VPKVRDDDATEIESTEVLNDPSTALRIPVGGRYRVVAQLWL